MGPGRSAGVSIGRGEASQQIVWNFTVCAGCCRSKDQDALDFKEGIHFRGLPQSLALLGSRGAALTMSHFHRSCLCRALSLKGSPNPWFYRIYLFLFLFLH